MAIQLIHGSAHSIPIPDGSVHCLVTSPPYWGLRKYAGGTGIEWPTVSYSPMPGLPPLRVQGCEAGCVHEWGTVEQKRGAGGEREYGSYDGGVGRGPAVIHPGHSYCVHCGGWRGELGLEPTPEMFIAHLILCLREWRRVLRADGTCFVNLGDSYNGSGGAGGDYAAGGLRDGQPKYPGRKVSSLKPKDLCGIPFRFAFAAQAEGFYLRSDIVWSKPNPMPESVTDRPTKAHEYIFLLAKSEKYFYDADAVREPHKAESIERMKSPLGAFRDRFDQSNLKTGNFDDYLERETGWGNPSGRNLRSVLTIATQPTPFAHFATYPERIPEIAILAGTSAYGCCAKCGAGHVRQTVKTFQPTQDPTNTKGSGAKGLDASNGWGGTPRGSNAVVTTGWQPSCECFGHFEMVERPRESYDDPDAAPPLMRVYVPDGPQPDPVPATVLDPFVGSGTTLRVAARLGRNGIGVDVSESYLDEIVPQRMGNGVQMEMAI